MKAKINIQRYGNRGWRYGGRVLSKDDNEGEVLCLILYRGQFWLIPEYADQPDFSYIDSQLAIIHSDEPELASGFYEHLKTRGVVKLRSTSFSQ